MRPLRHADKLIQFYLHRLSVTILRILNEKHHQKGHYRGAGIYHQSQVYQLTPNLKW